MSIGDVFEAAAELAGVPAPLARIGAALLKRLDLETGGTPQQQAIVQVVERAVHSAIHEIRCVKGAEGVSFDALVTHLAAAVDGPGGIDSLVRALLGDQPEAALGTAFRIELGTGLDLAELEKALPVDRFIEAFSSSFWDELDDAAQEPHSPLARVRDHATLTRKLERILDRLPASSAPELSDEDLRELLASYLRQVDSRARERPSRRYPEHFDFDALDQQVRVRTEPTRPTEPNDEHVYLPKGAHDPGREDETGIKPWAMVRERYQRMVVLGDPGYGKTWRLRGEARRLALATLHPLENGEEAADLVVPVWVRLDELALALQRSTTGNANRVPAALVDVLHGSYDLDPRFGRWLSDHVARRRCVLLLDALDEVPEASRNILEAMRGCARHHADSRIVITSRLAGYTGVPLDDDGLTSIELLPFSPGEIEQFIDAWFPSAADAERLRGHLRENVGAKGLSHIPLLLTLLCILASDPDEPLPTRRTELYDRILRRLLAREHRPRSHQRQDDVAAALRVLERIAIAFADRSQWTDRMLPDELFDALASCGAAYEDPMKAAKVLRKLAEQDGVLVPVGAPSRDQPIPYRFLHRTFHEYLVARHLARQPMEQWRRIVEPYLWFEPDWDEVIAMLAGLLPDPDPLLQLLADCADDPFRAGLCHAGRAVGELLPNRARTERAIRIVDRLLGLLGGPKPDHDTAVEVLKRLVAVGNVRAIDGLVTRLDDPDSNVRWTAAVTLARTTDPQALAVLVARLADPEAYVRWAAADALVGTTDPQAIAALIERLENPDSPVRVVVIAALRMSITDPHVRDTVASALAATDPETMDALIAHLDDYDPSMGVAATTGTLDPQAVTGLMTRLDDPDPEVRWAAVRALTGTTDPHARTGLIARLDDPELYVRAGAIAALESSTDPQAIAALIECLDDPVWLLRSAAAGALSVIDNPGEALERCALLRDRWAQASNQVREHLYAALARLAPKAYRAVPAAERPSWRAAMADVTRTAR